MFSESHSHFLNVVIENLTKLGNKLVEICSFTELNVTAVRKILKKFDKRFASISGVPLAGYFITSIIRRQNGKFIHMLNQKLICDIHLIIEDSYRQLKRIAHHRIKTS